MAALAKESLCTNVVAVIRNFNAKKAKSASVNISFVMEEKTAKTEVTKLDVHSVVKIHFNAVIETISLQKKTAYLRIWFVTEKMTVKTEMMKEIAVLHRTSSAITDPMQFVRHYFRNGLQITSNVTDTTTVRTGMMN